MNSNLITVKQDEMIVMAKKVFMSGMFSAKNENQIYSLMLIAESESIHPMKAVQQYHIINGKPALKSNEVLARFQRAGGRIKWITTDDEVAEATFSHEQAGEITIKWDIEKAKKAGIYDSNPVWKKYPSNMLRARVVTDGVNAVYPACLNGSLTESQAQDIPIEDFEDTEIEETKKDENNIEFLKKRIAMKLRNHYNFTNALLKEFADVYGLSDNIELLERLLSDDHLLLDYVEKFQKDEEK